MTRVAFLAIAICGVAIGFCPAGEWLSEPSTYTHDSLTGERVAQYTPIGPFYYQHQGDFLRSGYRHYRSTIQVGGSADNYHLVEEYGRPVRPYEEWRFPYRPYSAPYQDWGPPFGGLGPGGYGGMGPGGIYGGNVPFGPGFPIGGPGGFPGGGFPGGGFPGGGFPGGFPPANYAQPWVDGYYPTYDRNDRSRYYEPYR